MNLKHEKTLKQEEKANERADKKGGEDVRHPDHGNSAGSKVPTKPEDTDASGDALNGTGEDNHQGDR